MARKRKTNTKTGSATATSNINNNERTSNIMGLSSDQIKTLLAGTRTKGLYVQCLNEFIESGENGVDVRDQWAELEDKKATTLKQGFDNAREKKDAVPGADKIKVISKGDDVFLINLAVASEAGDVEMEAVEA